MMPFIISMIVAYLGTLIPVSAGYFFHATRSVAIAFTALSLFLIIIACYIFSVILAIGRGNPALGIAAGAIAIILCILIGGLTFYREENK
jgi:hypothetical protein